MLTYTLHVYIYSNKIIQEFKTLIKMGIQPNNRKLVNTILYADDQIHQKMIYKQWHTT